MSDFIELPQWEIQRITELFEDEPFFKNVFYGSKMEIEELARGRSVLSLPLLSSMEEDAETGIIWAGVPKALGFAACCLAAQTFLGEDDTTSISRKFRGTNDCELPIFLIEETLVCEATCLEYRGKTAEISGKMYTTVRGPQNTKSLCRYNFRFDEKTTNKGAERLEYASVLRALGRRSQGKDQT